ncbi:flagellar protein FlaG [Sporosarcina thermotolerans]|uniref:Flagellar protein FlaG n=1 Tax=Sporosarcina thermotolerans TaxID=633404 RepID=A0AAW9ACY7_9BACL|nr:flagellar protein FlaG [Sporosarcina thermotolerans]MDW0116973.1 flagellar protein FlaG [Sporosarcina thermotolerans]WHT47916.1 flagellar protein FlaG [Sporosarcina thermotolerans]
MVGRIGDASGTQQIRAKLESAAPEKNSKVAEVQAISVNVQEQSQEGQQLPIEKARQVTDSMNKFLESANTQLRFKLHDKLNEYYVVIIDQKTDEVVREIPSKKLMDTYAAMREFVGVLIDRKI